MPTWAVTTKGSWESGHWAHSAYPRRADGEHNRRRRFGTEDAEDAASAERLLREFLNQNREVVDERDGGSGVELDGSDHAPTRGQE